MARQGFAANHLYMREKCEEIIANHDIQGAHDKNKEFIGNGCHNFTKFIVRENLPGVYDN